MLEGRFPNLNKGKCFFGLVLRLPPPPPNPTTSCFGTNHTFLLTPCYAQILPNMQYMFQSLFIFFTSGIQALIRSLHQKLKHKRCLNYWFERTLLCLIVAEGSNCKFWEKTLKFI